MEKVSVLFWTLSIAAGVWVGFEMVRRDDAAGQPPPPPPPKKSTACTNNMLFPTAIAAGFANTTVRIQFPLTVTVDGRQSAQETLTQTVRHIESFQIPPAGECQSTESTALIRSIDITLTDSKQNEENEIFIDESYMLTIDRTGLRITAATSTGAIRAISTLSSLIVKHISPETWREYTYIQNTPIVISDAPATSYRSTMIDVARRYQSLQTLRTIVDAMFMSKLRVLHMHIYDDQSMPLSTKTLQGALAANTNKTTNEKMIYTKQDMLDFQLYARVRGVVLVPEFDMPGHSAIFGEAYPWSVVCNGRKEAQYNTYAYALQVPAGQLDIFNNGTLPMVVRFLEEMASEWFIHTNYIHLGGDELNTNCYSMDTTKRATFQDTLQNWLTTTIETLKKNKKTTVMWLDFVMGNRFKFVYNDTIFQAWNSPCSGVEKSGFRCIASNYGYVFLDCGIGVGPESGGCSFGGPSNGGSFEAPCGSWCGWNSPQHIYSWNFDLPSPTGLVVGGETLLWSERAQTENVPRIMFPRASVAGERMWANVAAIDAAQFPYDRVRYLVSRMNLNGMGIEEDINWKPTPQAGFRIYQGNFSDWCSETNWNHNQCTMMNG